MSDPFVYCQATLLTEKLQTSAELELGLFFLFGVFCFLRNKILLFLKFLFNIFLDIFSLSGDQTRVNCLNRTSLGC